MITATTNRINSVELDRNKNGLPSSGGLEVGVGVGDEDTVGVGVDVGVAVGFEDGFDVG